MCSAKVIDFVTPLATEGAIYAVFLITWYAESKPGIRIHERSIQQRGYSNGVWNTKNEVDQGACNSACHGDESDQSFGAGLKLYVGKLHMLFVRRPVTTARSMAKQDCVESNGLYPNEAIAIRMV
jgi:hypothetical protein